METIILGVETLPSAIREKLNAKKFTVHERDGGVILLPFSENSGLLGVASDSNLTVKKFLEYRKEDAEFDK